MNRPKNKPRKQPSRPTIKIAKLDDFRSQRQNANKHTDRGLSMLDEAMTEDGYVAPMTAAADGEMIDGSARLERAGERFGPEVIVIEHDGRRPIITKRTDIPNAKSDLAKRIAIRANRIAQVDLNWDPELLMKLEANPELHLDQLFSPDEWRRILAQLPSETDEAPEPQMERAAEFQEKTQIVAAEQLQRVCYALELEPKYCAVTLERLSQMGLKPRLLKPRQIKARKAA